MSVKSILGGYVSPESVAHYYIEETTGFPVYKLNKDTGEYEQVLGDMEEPSDPRKRFKTYLDAEVALYLYDETVIPTEKSYFDFNSQRDFVIYYQEGKYYVSLKGFSDELIFAVVTEEFSTFQEADLDINRLFNLFGVQVS